MSKENSYCISYQAKQENGVKEGTRKVVAQADSSRISHQKIAKNCIAKVRQEYQRNWICGGITTSQQFDPHRLHANVMCVNTCVAYELIRCKWIMSSALF